MVLLVVIPQGFEPWTHALEGRCSNPTELRNQTGRKVTQILANKQTLATFFNKNFQHAFKHSPHAPPARNDRHGKRPRCRFIIF